MAKKKASRRSPTVRISNPIARGNALPSLTKTKAFRALLLHAEQSGELSPGSIHTVPIEQMRDMLNCRDDVHLLSELLDLQTMVVNWSRMDPGSGGYTIPIPEVRWSKDGGQVSWTFAPMFLREWLDDRNGYRRLSWEVIASFRSLYAAKLYEFCGVSYEAGKLVTTRKMSVGELRDLLGVPSTAYQAGNIGVFFAEVRRAEKAVNEAQDGFRIAYMREGRGAQARHFFVVEDAPKQMRLPIAAAAAAGAKTVSGGTLRARIEQALTELPSDRRAVVTAALKRSGFSEIPSADDVARLKSYAGALYGEGVELPP